MFIRNMEDVSFNSYVCGKKIGNYLISKKMPLLGKKDRLMVFSRTKELEKVLAQMPLDLKILKRMNLIYG